MNRLLLATMIACLILVITGCCGDSVSDKDEQMVIVNAESIEINGSEITQPLLLSDISNALGTWDRLAFDEAVTSLSYYIWDKPGIRIYHNDNNEEIVGMSFTFLVECTKTAPSKQFGGTVAAEGLYVDKFTGKNEFRAAGYESAQHSPHAYEKQFGSWKLTAYFQEDGDLLTLLKVSPV